MVVVTVGFSVAWLAGWQSQIRMVIVHLQACGDTCEMEVLFGDVVVLLACSLRKLLELNEQFSLYLVAYVWCLLRDYVSDFGDLDSLSTR